jgi:tetratricopeptide (TPR) repeat protein
MRVANLFVIPRDKVLAFRTRVGATDLVNLGRQIGCRWMLSGTFQRAGDDLRVTTSLADVATGEVLFRDKIDGRVDAIFAIQDALTANVAAALRRHVPTPVGVRIRPQLSAYECYARGRRLWERRERGSFDQASQFYEQAVSREPAFAPALAGLAAIHAMRFTFTTDARDLTTAIQYATRAIEADPASGEPHIWYGYAQLRQEHFQEAYEAERTAARFAPDNAHAAYFAATALAASTRRSDALPWYQTAVALDPTFTFAWDGLGLTHLELGHAEGARWCLEKAVEVDLAHGPSGAAGVSGHLGECLRRLGDLAQARVKCLAGLDTVEQSDHMFRDVFRGVCLCSLGRTAIQQGDMTAARTAFGQAVAHLRGRPRALGGGHFLTQALAGLTRAGEGARPLDEALDLFANRAVFDFHWGWHSSDDVTLLELARAARVLERLDVARSLLEHARAAGSIEALNEQDP